MRTLCHHGGEVLVVAALPGATHHPERPAKRRRPRPRNPKRVRRARGLGEEDAGRRRRSLGRFLCTRRAGRRRRAACCSSAARTTPRSTRGLIVCPRRGGGRFCGCRVPARSPACWRSSRARRKEPSRTTRPILHDWWPALATFGGAEAANPLSLPALHEADSHGASAARPTFWTGPPCATCPRCIVARTRVPLHESAAELSLVCVILRRWRAWEKVRRHGPGPSLIVPPSLLCFELGCLAASHQADASLRDRTLVPPRAGPHTPSPRVTSRVCG